MLSKNMEKLWNEFSDDKKSEIEARFENLKAQYVMLQEIRKSEDTTSDTS